MLAAELHFHTCVPWKELVFDDACQVRTCTLENAAGTNYGEMNLV